MMPRMNGVELIEQIRSDPSFDGVDVVAMSGMPTMLARAQKAGADKILCKPLEPMVLVRALSRSKRTGVSSSPGAPVSPRDKEPQRSA
jgi:CheY-like chemotaxis protein